MPSLTGHGKLESDHALYGALKWARVAVVSRLLLWKVPKPKGVRRHSVPGGCIGGLFVTLREGVRDNSSRRTFRDGYRAEKAE